jgi:cell surface protein SprA
MQQLVLNYDIPINKIPLFSFVKANYSYTGDYNWQKSSNAFSQLGDFGIPDLGNTVQNARSNNLNTSFNMEMLYKYLGLTKNAAASKNRQRAPAPKPGEKVVNNNAKPKANNEFIDGLMGVLTSVKNIQVNYTENSGTVLPGYTPSVGFLGSSRPSLGFTFGSQDDVRFEAAKNGWLTTYQEFNQNFTQVSNTMLKATANVDLFPDLKIDLAADRSYSNNFSEQYNVLDGEYYSLSPYTYGLFSISTVLIKTSFSTSDAVSSAAFDDFRVNRLVIANRLATDRGIDINNPVNLDADGYPLGFGKNNQAVLLPAFMSAYTGSDASGVSLGIFRSVPIPNWSVKYSGLMRYELFKKNFKRFSLQHNYRASYTINQYRSNFDFDKTPDGVDASGNFFNKTIMSNVNLVEQFSPLIRMDFELKSSLKILTEIKKDRALSMSFDNNLLTEVKGIEYVVGLGYRFKDVIFSSRLADNPSGIIKGDINMKADFSYRNNQTIVRYLDYDNNQLAGGQNIRSLK